MQIQIQDFFEFPVDHFYASYYFSSLYHESRIQELCMVSPDTGGTQKSCFVFPNGWCDFAIGYKQRVKSE
jgi:phosphoribosylpyrophosphate synthetase